VFDSNRNTPENTNIERDMEIFTMDPDGSGIEQLTDNRTDDLMPAFSPGGERIAFVSARDGDEEVYVMDKDGSDQIRLTNNPASHRAFDWQPLIPKSRSVTVHPPDTRGPYLLMVASAMYFSVGVLLYAVVRRRMEPSRGTPA
jgi:dipeptidyl aminopeptidase/acylaminoacyl peptidase